MRKFTKGWFNFRSFDEIEDLLSRYYASTTPDTNGINFRTMAQTVIRNEGNINRELSFHERYRRKTHKVRSGSVVGACVLAFGLVTASFYFAPNWVQEVYGAVQSFTVSLSTLISGDPKILNSITSAMNSPLLSDLGNPSPAEQPTSSAHQVQLEMRGSAGPFNASVQSGHASLITVVNTLKGGISVKGNFNEGGYIICRDINNGHTYTGPVESGTVSESSYYITTPPGTYDVYIAFDKSRSTMQSYSSITVYFN